MSQEWMTKDILKKMLQYQPRVKRRLGRPLKQLLNDIQLEAETDHSGLNS
jgi:hypothetical protein